MKNMVLIVGLGNPGKKFKKTRHNIGFWVVDELRRKNRFQKFKSSKKFESLISESSLNRKKVILAKPQTFMNNSGKAVKILYTKYKILNTKNLWVIHDDIDLPLGKIRVSKARGAAGHKGVQSIIDELGTPKESLQLPTGQAKNFVRFRIGIQPKTGKPKNVAKFVLKKFTKTEEKMVKESIKKTISVIEMAITKGLEKAVSNK